MCPQRLGCIKPQWSYTAVFLAYANASKLVVFDNAKLNARVFFNVALQVFGKLLVALGRNHRQGIDLKATQALTLLIHAQAQATANGLTAPALRIWAIHWAIH